MLDNHNAAIIGVAAGPLLYGIIYTYTPSIVITPGVLTCYIGSLLGFTC